MARPRTKACPECHSEVALDAENCPNCPMSFEIERCNAQSRRNASGAPWLLLAALVAAAIGAWRLLGFVLSNANDRDKPPPTVAQIEAPAAATRPAAGKPRKDYRPWRLRGAVYDLVSLHPVPGVTIVLKDRELSRQLQVVTDENGRYSATLPGLPGRSYSVSFAHPGYSQPLLDADSSDLRAKTPAERRALAAELGRSLAASYLLEGAAGQPVVTDFYLAPR